MTKSSSSMRILIMAGGTGGHVFPALAVADELKARGVEIHWLGTRRGLEAEVVPQAGYDISYISVTGLRGKGFLGWFMAPGKLLFALSQGLSVVRRLRPSAVLGMGGFVTGPGGLAAWILRCPLLIHEQNAIAGLTNRLLAPLATRLMEAFPKALKSNKAVHTGNPVRSAIGLDSDNTGNSGNNNSELTTSTNTGGGIKRSKSQMKRRLLVVGGSLGAKGLNNVVPLALAAVEPDRRPEVWHQTGKKLISETRELYAQTQVSARIEPFIHDMATAYRWADLVLCRAGALTIAELAIAGVASVLVPYPYAVDDHQTVNAMYLVNAKAAILIQQSELSPEKLVKILIELDDNELNLMGQAALSVAKPNATSIVADHCMEVANG